jgi:hypothetical protein
MLVFQNQEIKSLLVPPLNPVYQLLIYLTLAHSGTLPDRGKRVSLCTLIDTLFINKFASKWVFTLRFRQSQQNHPGFSGFQEQIMTAVSLSSK